MNWQAEGPGATRMRYYIYDVSGRGGDWRAPRAGELCAGTGETALS